MQNNDAKRKYLTVQKFEEWVDNDWKHIKDRIYLNTKLILILIGGWFTITAGIVVALIIGRLA